MLVLCWQSDMHECDSTCDCSATLRRITRKKKSYEAIDASFRTNTIVLTRRPCLLVQVTEPVTIVPYKEKEPEEDFVASRQVPGRDAMHESKSNLPEYKDGIGGPFRKAHKKCYSTGQKV